MTLHDFMRDRRLSDEQFAWFVHGEPSAVRRWRKGLAIPGPDDLRLIILTTRGRVTPNDFFAREIAHAIRLREEERE